MKTKRLKRYLTKRVLLTYHYTKFEVVDDVPTKTEGFAKCELLLKNKGVLSRRDLFYIESSIQKNEKYNYVDIISYNVVG